MYKRQPYCFLPIDSTGFLPERSTKTLPCLGGLHRGIKPLRRGTSDSREQLHPRLQLNSLLPRGFPHHAGVGVGSGAMLLGNIHTVVGRCPAAITARACSMSSPSTLRPNEMYISPTTGQSRSSLDFKCRCKSGIVTRVLVACFNNLG